MPLLACPAVLFQPHPCCPPFVREPRTPSHSRVIIRSFARDVPREGVNRDEHLDGSAGPEHRPLIIQSTGPKVIQDAGEVPLVLYSDVRGPLASLSFLRRSLAMAELAMIAYNDEAEAQRAARAIGFSEAQLFDNDGSQAYRFRNEHDVVLACRGTEPTEWNDIQADANAVMSVVGTLGNVHSGFNREVDDLWPVLEELAPRQSRSRSGFAGTRWARAMATICAYRCKTSSIASDPQELHTFGSPRVGCKRYIRHAEVTPLPLGPQQRRRHPRAAGLDGLSPLRQRDLPGPLRPDSQADRHLAQPRPLARPARRLAASGNRPAHRPQHRPVCRAHRRGRQTGGRRPGQQPRPNARREARHSRGLRRTGVRRFGRSHVG